MVKQHSRANVSLAALAGRPQPMAWGTPKLSLQRKGFLHSAQK